MRPYLIVDNLLHHRLIIINIMRGITASTVAEDVPSDMVALIQILNGTPANTPSNSPAAPQNVVGFA